MPAGPGGRAPGSGAPGRFTTSIDPVRVLRRHVWLLVLMAVVGSVLGIGVFYYLNVKHPQYRGEVLFQVQPGLDSADQIGAQEISRDELVARIANTEVSVLLSRVVLQQAVQHPDILKTNWGKQFELTGGGIAVDDAIDDLIESLSAAPLRGTNLFRVSFSTSTASDVPVVLNRIRDAYLQRRENMEAADWGRNIDVFDREQVQIETQIRETQEEIANFIKEHGLQSIGDTRHHQLSLMASERTQQIAAVSSSLNIAEVALQQTELKIAGSLEPDSEERLQADAHPEVRSLSGRVTELKLLRREWEERFTPDHPELVRIERRIRNSELQRDVKKDEVIRSILEARQKQLRDEVERQRSLLKSLQAEADEISMRLSELAAHAAHYQSLEQRRARLETQREENRRLLDEIRLMRARADAARVRVAQDAFMPRQKSFPKPQIIVPLGMLGALFVTLGVIFLREITDQRIKSASDLAVVPTARVLGVIADTEDDPMRPAAPELVVREHPMSVVAESYRQACAALSRPIERNGHQTILFMSGLPSAGTTTAVTNIAASLAASGKRVVVVDANFRRPRLAEAMGVPAGSNAPGLGDLLAGSATIDEVIVNGTSNGHDSGIAVVPAGTPANRVIERLNNGTFESIVAELRDRFDLILFDAPPAVVAGDAMVLANRLDAAVLVARANQEQKGLVARILGQLADARCESLGVLLNRPRGTAGGYFKKNFRTMAKYARK